MDPLNASTTVEDKKLPSSLSNTESHDVVTREGDEKGERSKAPTFQPQLNSTENKDDENFEFLPPVNNDATEGQQKKTCSTNKSYFDGQLNSRNIPTTSSVRSEEWVETPLDAQTSPVPSKNEHKALSTVSQPNPGVEKITLENSESANDGQNVTERITHGNLIRMETIPETSDRNSVNRFPEQAELEKLHIEFGRLVEDLRSLDEYSKVVLDSSKSRLHDIIGRLQTSKQENQLSVDVNDMITEVNTRLEVLNEHRSPKNNDLFFNIKEDTHEATPNIDGTNTQIPLFDSNDIDLLLFGSSGNGKSATGNAILRNNVFQTAAGTSSNASISAKSSSKYNDLTVNVVDASGVDTNGKSKLEVLELSLQSIKEALELCEYSFTALLIVIKFGARFTQHEKETIKIIRGVLGNDVIQKYGVCVVTHGDNFEYEMAEEEEKANIMTFEEWCRAQEGEIGELFKECSFRCVLFNNRTKDKTKREDQLEKLLSLIKNNEKYSRGQFLKADEGLLKLTQELFLPEVIQNTNKMVNEMRSKLVTMKFSFDSIECFEKANEMIVKLNHYKESILAACWDESAKSNILCVIEPMELELNSKLKMYNASKADRRNLIKAKSFDQTHFCFNKKDVAVSPTGEASRKQKVYSQFEINKTEQAIKIELRKLKDFSRDFTGNTLSEETWLNEKITEIKDTYYDFLSSQSGERMVREISRFQIESFTTRKPTHVNESSKWELTDTALKPIKYILSFFVSKN